MRKISYLILILSTISRAQAQDSEIPEWTMTVKVVDEQNQPVTNAVVKVWWHVPPSEGQSIAMTNVAGLTGNDGIFTVTEHSGSSEVTCEANKEGYYGTGQTYEFAKFRRNDPSRL